MTATILDGRARADRLRAEVAAATARLAPAGVKPGLAVVLVGEDPASQIYVAAKGRAAVAAGISSFEHRLPASTPESALLALVHRLNADPAVDGILVQMPLPRPLDAETIIEAIDPAKDVDGLTPENAGRLLFGKPGLVPCTPMGAMILAREALAAAAGPGSGGGSPGAAGSSGDGNSGGGSSGGASLAGASGGGGGSSGGGMTVAPGRIGPGLAGKRAVVIGRSILVGKPLALLLLAADATVTTAHSRTQDLAPLCREAEILVAAVGRPGLVRGDWIRPGAVVVDVGINRVPAPDLGPDKTRLVGDVAFEEARAVAGHITPVPGGVGPMTIACLLANTVTAACRRRGLPAPVWG
jgi:methylenetetrahydrofolate dehydrogenase (NADP+)/methenyltetrahydrofolate cyclohydrolase